MKETPDDPELLDLDGQILVCNRKFDEACKQFRKAINKAPPRSTATCTWQTFFGRGWIEKRMPTKSCSTWSSNPLNAKSVAALQKYADYLREQEKFDEALVAGRSGSWNWRRKTPWGCGSPDVATWQRERKQ